MSYWQTLLKLKVPVKKDPRTLPVWRKRLLLGLVCFIAIIPGFCSTIYVSDHITASLGQQRITKINLQLPALEAIIEELNSPSIMVTLSNSLFMLFMGIAVRK